MSSRSLRQTLISLFLCAVALGLTACKGNGTANAAASGDTLQLKYATLLTITDYDGY